MNRFVWRTIQANGHAWSAPAIVVVAVSALVDVSLTHFVTCSTPAMVERASALGIGTDQLRETGITVYALTALVGTVTLSIVSSATVQAQQRMFAQWRLAGATPGQIRRFAIGLVALIALLGSAAGALLGIVLAPPVVQLLNSMLGLGDVPVPPSGMASLLTLGVAELTCLLSVIKPARLAATTPANRVFRDEQSTSPGRQGFRLASLVMSALCCGGLGYAVTTVQDADPGIIANVALWFGMCIVVTFHIASPWLFPRLLRRLGSLAPRTLPSWRLASRSAASRTSRSIATIAPLAFGMGCTGVLVGMVGTNVEALRQAGNQGHFQLTDTYLIVVVTSLLCTLCSVAVVTLHGRGREHEFALLRASGATTQVLRREILAEAVLMVLAALIPALIGTIGTAGAVAYMATAAIHRPVLPQIPWVLMGGITLAAMVVFWIALAIPSRGAATNIRQALTPE